ncbi:MAG: hypothetical protein HXS47_13140 [Theionarchaea archaeon]|nr:hypothetical protein [Theionarchaea archaeon]
MILLNATEFIIKVVGMIMEICELIADQISELTSGLVPSDAVDELGILIILLLLRAGFDFTRKVLEILIIIFALFLFIQVLPTILALF